MSKTFFFLRNIDTSHLSTDRREAWMPKGDLPYYDKMAQRTFTSKAEKRRWLRTHGMREAGELANPSKHIQGRAKTQRTPEQQRIRDASRQYIEQQGGVSGLLDRIQREPQRYV